jgi:leucyl-tRNA synthetase
LVQGSIDVSSADLPVVSTAGFDGESGLRRFRRLSVADVLARHVSQLLGQRVALIEAPPAEAEEEARDDLAAAAAAVLGQLPRARLAISGDKLILKCEDLLDDLLDSSMAANWPEAVLSAQRAAIGRSRGAFARFARSDGRGDIEVFTTRPDTIFGASFVAVSLSHPAAQLARPEQLAAFQAECDAVADDPNAKVGIPLGLTVQNPFQPERLLPVWLANFVVDAYGTGAAGGCPACDQRDLDFARRYGLDVLSIVCPPGMDPDTYEVGSAAHAGDGTIINSGFLSGLPVAKAIDAAIERLAETGRGRPAVQYRRPSLLVADAAPDRKGDIQFRDRHWRFTGRFLTAAAVVPPAGGQRRPHVLHVTAPETAARHLLDARILMRALGGGPGAADQEPWEELVLIGEILGSSGEPGAEGLSAEDDALRLAVLADTPPERELEWNDSRHAAALRFVEGASRLFTARPGGPETGRASLARDIAKPAMRLQDALRRRRLNTAVAAVREITAQAGTRAAAAPLDKPAQELLAALLYSLLPGLTRGVLAAAGSSGDAAPAWPGDLADAGGAEMIQLAVQINGKKRGTVQVAPGAGEEAVLAAIQADRSLSAHLDDKPIRKFILVPNRLVNVVV